MRGLPVRIQWCRGDGPIRSPAYMTAGASGADLHAVLDRPRLLHAGQTMQVPTGIAIELPDGFEAQVRPRSGLSAQGILAVLGTIDSDYRGEISVTLVNLSHRTFDVVDGLRLAQLVIAPVARARFEWALDLAPSDRGTRGFGSTGLGPATTVHHVQAVALPASFVPGETDDGA